MCIVDYCFYYSAIVYSSPNVFLGQVDIGQGRKPPGYYVQRSCGLFPAPYPQNSPHMKRLCALFELLGIFLAKCIQDKRRVDLPLARPFFKLMSTTRYPMEGYGQQECVEPDQCESPQSKNNQQLTEDVRNDTSYQERVSNMHRHSPPIQPSSGNQNVTDVGATSAKEVELQMLVTGEGDEITKDSGGEREEKEKEEVVLEELGEGGLPEAPWFEGILQLEDLEEVNPYR